MADLVSKLRGFLPRQQDEAGAFSAKVLAIAASKGGVGKTTTAINLGLSLSNQGFRVLLVDLDPQAHVRAALHLRPAERSLSEILLGRQREVKDVAEATRWPELWVAGSNKDLAETEMLLSTKIGKELILNDCLAVTKSHYDLIILDCPPNLGTLTLNALCAADALLVPSDMSALALEGAGDMLATVATLQRRLGRNLSVLGILPTRIDPRATRLNSTLSQSFVDLHGDLFLPVHIPQSAPVNRAHITGKTLFEAAKTSAGARAYVALAALVAMRLGLKEGHQSITDGVDLLQTQLGSDRQGQNLGA